MLRCAGGALRGPGRECRYPAPIREPVTEHHAPGDPAPRGSGRDPQAWLRRMLGALAALSLVLVVTGLYLTFEYRPAPGTEGHDGRPGLVGVAQSLHTIGAYAFVAVVFVVVGLALAVASRRDQAPAAVAAAGIGLVLVALGFVVTGRQLPWSALEWVTSELSRSFEGIVGFPSEVRSVLVGNDDLSPARYETLAWIHIAGLPVFAVFAAWWMIGALQTGHRTDGDGRTHGSAEPAVATTPTRPVGLAEQLFGTDDPDTVRLQVDAFLNRHLRMGLGALDFTRVGTGIILGVRTTDGRPVVVRCFPPGTSTAYVRAVQDVQMHLAVQGFPAPKPLLDPQPFGVGIATVETLLGEPPRGDPVDPDGPGAGDGTGAAGGPGDPGARWALASGLATFVRLAAPLARHAELAGRGPLAPPAPGSVFPKSPGGAFDFAATAAGAEWIEEIGARARSILDAAPPRAPVVGHFAWRVDNVPVAARQVIAVFGWEQLGSAAEAVVLGSAAHQFTIDGRAASAHVPTPDEVRAFVTDYETARGRPLDDAERTSARAAYVFCTAYGARCEHVLAVSGQPAPAGFRERLAAYGAALLP